MRGARTRARDARNPLNAAAKCVRVRTALLSALLLLAFLPQPAAACGVPCGYVYPLIRMELDTTKAPFDLPREGGLTLPVKLVFSFDAGNEGIGPTEPGKPIVVTFEYPKKPRWAEITVTPENVEIPIQPQYLRPDPSDPNNAKVHYVYETDVTIDVRIVDQPVLRQGAEFAKLLVFAKSTESGLYKPAYGIKEVRAVPEGATFEAADATPDAPDAPEIALSEQARTLGGVALKLVPGVPDTDLWDPTPFTVQVDPPAAARLNVALVDEEGRVLYTTGPRAAPSGRVSVNLTFPEVGLYHVLAFAQPLPGAPEPWAPLAAAFPVGTGEATGAFRMPQAYKLAVSEAVSEFRGETADPAAQYEKFVPLPVFDGASSGTLALALRTDGPLAAGGGPANVNVQLLDPNGAVVAQGVVDALNPVRSVTVSGFPGTGLFQLRLFGAGLNALGAEGATVDLVATVNYDGRPTVANAHDGRLDAPTVRATYGRLNATLAGPVAAPLWEQVDVAADLAFADSPAAAYTYQVAVVGPEGAPVAGLRRVGADSALASPLSFPTAGRHLVAFLVASDDRDWQETPLVFVAEAGDLASPTLEYPATYAFDAETAATASPAPHPVAAFVVPVLPGATSAHVEAAGMTLRARDAEGVVDQEAQGALDLGEGTWLVEVVAPPSAGGTVAFGAEVVYPGPVSVANPDAPAPPEPEQGIPALGLVAVLLALLGAARRR